MKTEALRRIVAALLAVAALAGAAALLLGIVHEQLQPRIADNERKRILSTFDQLLPPQSYDNAILDDTLQLEPDALLGNQAPVTAWRARRAGTGVAVILPVVAANGYGGAIHLYVAVLADGTLAGVRSSAHQETPGLGDGIETDHSDWILQFEGASLTSPEPESWAVRRDGGHYDQLSGATITSRAVVLAVHDALLYFQANQDLLLDRNQLGEPQQ